MVRRAVILFSLLFFSLLFPFSPAAAGDTAVQGEGAVYTDRDLEKYKNPSDSEHEKQGKKSVKTEGRKEDPAKAKERQEQEYWCKRAQFHQKKLEKAQREVEKAQAKRAALEEEAAGEIGATRKKVEKSIKETEKRLQNAQKDRAEREKDLGRIEEEARRKGIPPGWLRCQSGW
ncbi:MAG: hypothetical protein U0411_11535 [Thermodesulfovibrionales bacterium]